MRKVWLVPTGALVLLAAGAGAQVPPDLAAKIRAAGQSMDPAIGNIYAPLFPPAAWRGVTIRRDIAYGADPKLFADVVELKYLPQERAGGCESEYEQISFAFKTLISPHVDKRQAKRALKRRLKNPDALR